MNGKKKFIRKFKRKSENKPNEDEEITKLQEQYSSINPQSIEKFSDFPLSWKTLKGLNTANFRNPTEIQKESIGFALQGRDILGAAVTGSGKTLAFLIPVLENLYLKKWTRIDGVGAIIISPTRELAYQIFETLKKVGYKHEFSGGLVIGGKNLKFERQRMDQCNIIICTPGRLLQHMDENPLFDATTLQVLVLDEADRCLDMGFEQTMNGILENLPKERQTLLFSATQTKSVKDLARMSLKNPAYVAPHEQQMTTPESLQQNYVVVNLEEKITMLWSFIKNHLKQKCIVFMSSCKQVKYIYEIFCKLRPGVSLLALYGTLHQDRRVAIYEEFCRKNSVVLFATDIASRGLDFPVVNWVIQFDCPEDVTQYIHRAGRTARHNARGESLLILCPSEQEAMLRELTAKKISIQAIKIDSKRLFSPRAKMEAYLAQSKELKESAQRAFVAYIKSVVLMKNKDIFDADKLDFDAFAHSLGLAVTPRVRFLERLKKRTVTQNRSSPADQTDNSDLDSGDEQPIPKDGVLNFNLLNSGSASEGEDIDFIKLKRRDHDVDEESDKDTKAEEQNSKNAKAKLLTKAALAKRVLKKNILPNTKVVFNEEGDEIAHPTKQLQSELAKEYIRKDDGGIDLEMAKKVLEEEDKFDKARFKELVKVKHWEKKKKLKGKSQKVVDDVEMDDFGEDDDGDDDVDLSWLPDPDRIYGPASESQSEDEEDDGDLPRLPNPDRINGSSDESSHEPPQKLVQNRKVKNRKVSISKDEEDIAPPLSKKAKKIVNKLSVDEAETLAMKLLGNGQL